MVSNETKDQQRKSKKFKTYVHVAELRMSLLEPLLSVSGHVVANGAVCEDHESGPGIHVRELLRHGGYSQTWS